VYGVEFEQQPPTFILVCKVSNVASDESECNEHDGSRINNNYIEQVRVKDVMQSLAAKYTTKPDSISLQINLKT
jgi:hypothetical protein